MITRTRIRSLASNPRVVRPRLLSRIPSDRIQLPLPRQLLYKHEHLHLLQRLRLLPYRHAHRHQLQHQRQFLCKRAHQSQRQYRLSLQLLSQPQLQLLPPLHPHPRPSPLLPVLLNWLLRRRVAASSRITVLLDARARRNSSSQTGTLGTHQTLQA